MEVICLFPIPNSLLMKGTTLPFHIFEPRYLEMVERAVRDELPVAVCPSHSNGDYIGQICVGGALNIVQENANGTKMIVISGEAKYKIHRMIQEKPFRIFEAEELKENKAIDDHAKADLTEIKNYFLQWSKRNIHNPAEAERIQTMVHNSEQLISYSALFLLKDVHEKQKILEASNFNQKIELIKTYLLPKEIKISQFLPPIKLTKDED
jgi:Lon protease-like protein